MSKAQGEATRPMGQHHLDDPGTHSPRPPVRGDGRWGWGVSTGPGFSQASCRVCWRRGCRRDAPLHRAAPKRLCPPFPAQCAPRLKRTRDTPPTVLSAVAFPHPGNEGVWGAGLQRPEIQPGRASAGAPSSLLLPRRLPPRAREPDLPGRAFRAGVRVGRQGRATRGRRPPLLAPSGPPPPAHLQRGTRWTGSAAAGGAARGSRRPARRVPASPGLSALPPRPSSGRWPGRPQRGGERGAWPTAGLRETARGHRGAGTGSQAGGCGEPGLVGGRGHWEPPERHRAPPSRDSTVQRRHEGNYGPSAEIHSNGERASAYIMSSSISSLISEFNPLLHKDAGPGIRSGPPGTI